MEDINAQILLEGFGKKMINSFRIRTGLICQTEGDIYELRKTVPDSKKIIFINEVKEHLYTNGFRCVLRMEQSVEELPYFIWDGNYYILMKYQERTPIEPIDPEAVCRGAAQIARMHLAAVEFFTQGDTLPAPDYSVLYEKRKVELLRIRKRLKKKRNLSAIDFLVYKNADYYSRLAQFAIDFLQGAGYGKLFETAEQNGTLCHNNCRSENFLELKNKEILIDGFEQCRIGLQVYDLAEWIRRYLKQEEIQPAVVLQMIESYHSVRPLSREEYLLLCGFLLFPVKFFRLLNQHYNNRRVCVSDSLVEKFQRCILMQEKNNQIFRLLLEKQ
ncbi:MAG: hypothetical protein KHZ62_03345 [Clostridiales bacterium]|nr:hypothetical protein [Clostridiales bacterium]